MRTITATEARRNLYSLLAEAAEGHEPIQITGRQASGILVSEQDWRSIQETLYLVSVPGMRESIVEGLKAPLEECDEDPAW